MNRPKSVYLFIIGIILFSCQSSATHNKGQDHRFETDPTKPILFSNSDFRDQNREPNLIDEFRLNQDPYLNIHFELERPLVDALRMLDGSLSEDELMAKGNFQFTFLVDGVEVYSQDLHPGAGLPDDKMNKTDYAIPLLYPERIDYWGWYLWLRFMKMGGGEDALADGQHQLTIIIKPYLQLEETIVGDPLALGEIAVDVKEVPYDIALAKIQNIPEGSGWGLSDDNYDKGKIEELNKKIAQNRFIDINGIAVVKNGKLLIEEYFNGADRETLHNPRSVGKTIASSIMGIAIADGYLPGEEQTLKEYYELKEYKNYHPLKEEVTLQSLLTMSSNFIGNDDDYDSPGNEENMYPTDDWVKFTLDLPIDEGRQIGESFEYFTAGVVVLGDIIDKSVPGGLVEYTDKKLFEPLGITKRNWQYTPQNVGNTAGGLQLRTVDFAKWGQVYKNNGLWEGQQLIPEEWVRKSLDHQITQENVENGTYGYLFWNNIYTVDGVDYAYSSCSGNGGNKIYIFKDIPLVVAITASAYGMPFAHRQVDQMMERYILPAVLTD